MIRGVHIRRVLATKGLQGLADGRAAELEPVLLRHPGLNAARRRGVSLEDGGSLQQALLRTAHELGPRAPAASAPEGLALRAKAPARDPLQLLVDEFLPFRSHLLKRLRPMCSQERLSRLGEVGGRIQDGAEVRVDAVGISSRPKQQLQHRADVLGSCRPRCGGVGSNKGEEAGVALPHELVWVCPHGEHLFHGVQTPLGPLAGDPVQFRGREDAVDEFVQRSVLVMGVWRTVATGGLPRGDKVEDCIPVRHHRCLRGGDIDLCTGSSHLQGKVEVG
mmetsp:Transcript_60548/g.180309  ORF Transcript_60548/g.180309 Transcript_60548/m.180309 type:complete len:277 (-) Transcript_60548:1773-2603(-)